MDEWLQGSDISQHSPVYCVALVDSIIIIIIVIIIIIIIIMKYVKRDWF